jgi:hypothetical protein
LENEKLVQGLRSLNEENIYLLDYFVANNQNLVLSSGHAVSERLDIQKLIEESDFWKSVGDDTSTIAPIRPLIENIQPLGPDEQRLGRMLSAHNYELEIEENVRVVKLAQLCEIQNGIHNEEAAQIIDEAYLDNIEKALVSPSNRFGKECFLGKLPSDVFEDELLELIEPFGPIIDLQLYINPNTGLGLGYAIVCFSNKTGAQQAIKMLNNYEIRESRRIVANDSLCTKSLYISGLPTNVTREQLTCCFSQFLSMLLVFSRFSPFCLFHLIWLVFRILLRNFFGSCHK